MGGMFGVIGILSALRVREQTGRGQLVNSALFENNAFLVGTHMAQAQLSEEPPRPMPTRRATWAVYDIFLDRDGGQVFVAAVSDGQWRDLCDEFGLTGLAEDPALEHNQGRVDQRERIHAELQAALSRLSLAEIEEKCTRRGLPVAPVNTPADLTSDPHLVASGALAATGLPDGESVDIRCRRSPSTDSDWACAATSPPPVSTMRSTGTGTRAPLPTFRTSTSARRGRSRNDGDTASTAGASTAGASTADTRQHTMTGICRRG